METRTRVITSDDFKIEDVHDLLVAFYRVAQDKDLGPDYLSVLLKVAANILARHITDTDYVIQQFKQIVDMERDSHNKGNSYDA